MCGISGIIDYNGVFTANDRIDIINKMNQQLHHRGPDSCGYYSDNFCTLGHTRLSIIDLASGQQPLKSSCGRYVLSFNGEIYNYPELKQEMMGLGYQFLTSSDTEVLLNALIHYGSDALNKIDGMFSFAFWDNKSETLIVGRDRLGKKPFYYYFHNGLFCFASEIRALLNISTIPRTLNQNGLANYLLYDFFAGETTPYNSISKLKAGHFIILTRNDLKISAYWNISFSHSQPISEREASHKLLDLLDNAVKKRLVADVPVGCFLSGGLDSSALVCLASQSLQIPLKTFSIAIDHPTYDESFYFEAIAKKFNTDHTTFSFRPDELLKYLDQALLSLDEPLGDASFLPTWLLCQQAVKHVKVALCGDGADEIFAGYQTFIAERFANLIKYFKFLPPALHALQSILPISHRYMSFDFKLRQFIQGLDQSGAKRHLSWLMSLNSLSQDSVFKNSPESSAFLNSYKCDSDSTPESNWKQIFHFYQKYYLEGNILVKSDRASMSHGLELRAPFLDHHLVEFANQLPLDLKLKGLTTKFILRRAMMNKLPAMITQRSKQGFGIPIGDWLCGPLKNYLCDTLSYQNLSQLDFLKADAIIKMRDDHINKKANHRKFLYSLLVLITWLKRQ